MEFGTSEIIWTVTTARRIRNIWTVGMAKRDMELETSKILGTVGLAGLEMEQGKIGDNWDNRVRDRRVSDQIFSEKFSVLINF